MKKSTEIKQGVGVIVSDFQPVIRKSIDRVSQRQRQSGGSAWEADDQRKLTVDQLVIQAEATAPSDVRRLLGLEDDQLAAIRDRRYLLDGRPVALSTSYLPAATVAGSAITQPNTGPGGIYARLDELDLAPVHFREDVTARMPSPEESEALDLAAETPVMVVTRTAFTKDGTPVEVNRMTLDAASVTARYDFGA